MTCLDILVRMDNPLSLLSFFPILRGTAFIKFENALLLKNLDFGCFWNVLIGKIIGRISKCLSHGGAANSTWEHLPFALQLFQKKRTEHFASLFSLMLLFIFMLCCFKMNLKLQNAAHRLCFCWVYLLLCDRSETSARFSSGVPNTAKRMKAWRRRRSAFIVSRCLEPLMKTEAQVFELASQTSVRIKWNYFQRIGN